MGTAERVRDLVEPLLASRSLELVDVELIGAQLRLTVDRDGGIDLDALSEATRVVSRALDEHDPMPDRYTLEVSSPGLERPLRTPAQFARAVGAEVSIKTVPGVGGDRRVRGALVAVHDDGITLRLALDGAPGGAPGGAIDRPADEDSPDRDPSGRRQRRLRYDEIERARTVFEWGPAPRPGKPNRNQTKKKKADSR